ALSQKLLREHFEMNQRLIDLGKHLGIICHDITNLISRQKFAIEILSMENAEKKSSTEVMTKTIDSLSRSTDHIMTLQKCVLAMSRNDTEDLCEIDGQSLKSTIGTLLLDLCTNSKPYLRLDVDCNQTYYCAPYALVFAIANAVNNSFDAWSATSGDRETFFIQVNIARGSGGDMLVTIRDNGPGFPETVLKSAFKNRSSIGQDMREHLGMGLQNIARYVSFQGGSVAASNEKGAVITITIPFAKA